MAGGRDDGVELPDAPGWYPDPWSATGDGERYFDGRRWGSTEKPLARHTTIATDERPTGRTAPARGPRRWVRPVVVVALLLGGVWALNQYRQRDSSTAQRAPSRPSGASTERLPAAPPPSDEEQARPIGAPAVVPEGAGQYEILLRQEDDPDTPVAFDPCRPVHYVVNPEGAPSDGVALVQEALDRVQTATGLQFVYDGTTTEAPTKDRAAFQPDRYGDRRWAPVLIAWTDEAAFPSLAGYIAGAGAGQPVYTGNGSLVYVSGQVALDRAQLSPTEIPDRGEVRAVVLHELGHLVGLDHTSDRSQLMFSEAQFDVRDFGDGDLRGLATLGTQACFPGV